MTETSGSLQLLLVRTTAAAAEALDAALEERGALGSVVERKRGARLVRLQAYFPPEVDVPVAWVREKLQELRGYDVPVGPAEVRVRSLPTEDWAESWKQHFHPVRVSANLIVAPTWERLPAGECDQIRIDPGMAFGTGDHPTTLGCLQMMERLDLSAAVGCGPYPTADVGSGTGILSIRAVQLGIGPVEAFETDPEAVRCGRENAVRNGVGEKIDFHGGSMPPRGAGPYRWIVANLFLTVLGRLTPRFSRSLVAGGELIVAGITDDQEDRLRERAENSGFQVADRICERVQRGGRRWPVLRFRKG